MPTCISSDGVTLHYELHGDDNATEKVILIMGLLTDGRAWQTIIDYFLAAKSSSSSSSSSSSTPSSSRYQFLTYDNRGIGRSSSFPITSLCTTSRMALDAITILHHVKWTAFHVVGVSMGGMIAQQVALQVPRHNRELPPGLVASSKLSILSLTLIATHAGGWTATAPSAGVWGIAKSLFVRDDQARIDGLMATVYSATALATPSIYQRLLTHHRQRIATRITPSLSGLLGHPFAATTHHLSYPSLLTLRYSPYPILILVGEHDILVRTINSSILKKILGAFYVVIEEGGHGLPTERPEEVGRELERQWERAREWRRDEQLVYAQGRGGKAGEGEREREREREGVVGRMGQEEKIHLLGVDTGRYGREIEALNLCCKHSPACAIHDLRGGLKGFLLGYFLHRFLLYPSSPLLSSLFPSSSSSSSSPPLLLLLSPSLPHLS